MKKIEAYFAPFQLDTVLDSLAEIGIEELSVSESRFHGKKAKSATLFREAEYVIDFLPQIKLEIEVNDGQLEECVNTLCRANGHEPHTFLRVLDIEQSMSLHLGTPPG